MLDVECLITCCVLNQNALTTLCRLLEKNIIYFAESKQKLECVRTKVHCATITCLLHVRWTSITPPQASHPFALPLKGLKSYTTCQSYKQLNIVKEINTSITVISSLIKYDWLIVKA